MANQEVDDERRQRSEEARRAALRQRLERQKEQGRQIAADLAKVDDRKAAKRIVFEDDDDEADATVSTSSGKKSANRLFDDDDDDDDNEEEEEVMIRNRHSGAKGEKLMRLEARFNSDPRFKLDDKFAESDEDDGEEIDEQKRELNQEKEKNRELLSKILGKAIGEDKKTKNSVDLLMARPFTRFDPENPEHVEWMRAFEESKQKTKKVPVEEKKQEEEEEEKQEEENEDDVEDEEAFEKAEVFYHVDNQLAEELSSQKPFSFLEMVGRKREDSEEDEEEEKEEEEKVKKVKKPLFEDPKPAPKPILNTGHSVAFKFFVDSRDEQVQSMAANFRRTQTIERVIDRWTPHRDAIFKIWKKQRKDAIKLENNRFDNNSRKRKAQETSEPESAATPAVLDVIM